MSTFLHTNNIITFTHHYKTSGRMNKFFLASGVVAFMILMVGVVFIWQNCTTEKSPIPKSTMDMEGPHIMYTDYGIESTIVRIDGRKFDLQKKKLDFDLIESEYFTVALPHANEEFSFQVRLKHEITSDIYNQKSKILAISDVEGDFDYLRNILRGNGVIDENFDWIFGTGHLAILGDIFDRGNHVTESLWLIYKLEQEAASAGGGVHLILGNHEAMALSGDERYLNKKYRNLALSTELQYMHYFGNHSVLGNWLRTKNAIEIIGNTLFVHGGISLKMIQSQLSITQINEIVRDNINEDINSKRGASATERLAMGTNGPLWYRGYVDQTITSDEVVKILNYFNIDQIVVGHTLVKDITPLYEKRIYPIDVERSHHLHTQTGLFIEKGIFYKTNAAGKKIKI